MLNKYKRRKKGGKGRKERREGKREESWTLDNYGEYRNQNPGLQRVMVSARSLSSRLTSLPEDIPGL
jgi:hypothetical protein